MRTIRKGCFETNSSSCHAITICSESSYKGYLDGKLVYFYRIDGIKQEGKIEIKLFDVHFYDIDGLYDLIQKRKAAFYALGDNPERLWLFRASKKEIEDVLFKGNSPKDEDEADIYLQYKSDWGQFLKCGYKLYSRAITENGRDLLVDDNDNYIRDCKYIEQGVIKITGDIGVNGG